MSLSRQLPTCNSNGFRVLFHGATLLAVIGVCVGSAFGANPSIGGTPTELDEDVFTSPESDWEAVVYSYAFLGVDEADDVPVGLPDPIDGQTLCVQCQKPINPGAETIPVAGRGEIHRRCYDDWYDSMATNQ